MPGFLVTVGATVTCVHGGTAQPLGFNPRVKVNGQPIITQVNGYAIASCPLASVPPTPFCATAQWVVPAQRVRAGGLSVVLQDSQAVCANTGTGLNTIVTQIRVKGM